MKLSTSSTDTFDGWFKTLQQVAIQDYNLAIIDTEQGEWVTNYTNGQNQNEALES